MRTFKIMLKPVTGTDWAFAFGTFGTDAEAVTWAEKTVAVGYEWMTVVVHTDGEGTRQLPSARKLSPCYCDSAYHPAGC